VKEEKRVDAGESRVSRLDEGTWEVDSLRKRERGKEGEHYVLLWTNVLQKAGHLSKDELKKGKPSQKSTAQVPPDSSEKGSN